MTPEREALIARLRKAEQQLAGMRLLHPEWRRLAQDTLAFLSARPAERPDLDGACPCEHVTPCHPDCSCRVAVSSRGCERCCRYGSPEQQRAAAERLTDERPDLEATCSRCGQAILSQFARYCGRCEGQPRAERPDMDAALRAALTEMTARRDRFEDIGWHGQGVQQWRSLAYEAMASLGTALAALRPALGLPPAPEET